MPTYGSSAYKYERVYEEPKKKAKKGVSKKHRTREMRKNVLAFIIVTGLAFVLLFRYACITEMSSRLTRLKGEYDEIQSVAVAKEFELEQEIDLKKVEEIATSQLGMQRPEKHQIVYVDMQNSDYTENTRASDGQNGVLAVITGAWEKLWEYFN